MARKTKEEAQETRNAILDAAELVFVERGVSHTSLAAIAAAAGVTRGAIYWHFASKAALFEALSLRVIEPLEAKLLEMQAQPGDNPLDLLRFMTSYFFERVIDDPRYSRFLEIVWLKCEYVGEMAAIRDTHLQCSNDFLDINVEAFRLASERGYLPAALDPRCAAIGLRGLVDGLVVNWTLDNSLFPLRSYGPAIIDAYLAGLQRGTSGIPTA
ncbi:MAG: TetR family transcriptional regulator [Propionivibrio sp.]